MGPCVEFSVQGTSVLWQPEEYGAECVLGMVPRTLVARETDGGHIEWRPGAQVT